MACGDRHLPVKAVEAWLGAKMVVSIGGGSGYVKVLQYVGRKYLSVFCAKLGSVASHTSALAVYPLPGLSTGWSGRLGTLIAIWPPPDS